MSIVTTFKLPPELRAKTKAVAESKQRSMNWVINEALERYVDDCLTEERFQLATVSAFERYQQTGRHITQEEFEKWVTSWGTKQEGSTPKCHS